MIANGLVAAARASLGRVGVLLPVSSTDLPSIDGQRAAVVRLEDAGYRSVWVNEVLGKDTGTQLAILLAATRRMTFGTSITNIWARAPQTAHGAASMLAQAFPGRFVLGLGVGYPEQARAVGREFGRPLAMLRDYRERMAAPTVPPVPDASYPLLIAANGPKMLALACEIADGALPAAQPPEFTATARATLGPDKLLVVATRLDDDDPAATVRAHLAAGADQVEVMIGGEFATRVDRLVELAPALITA